MLKYTCHVAQAAKAFDLAIETPDPPSGNPLTTRCRLRHERIRLATMRPMEPRGRAWTQHAVAHLHGSVRSESRRGRAGFSGRPISSDGGVQGYLNPLGGRFRSARSEESRHSCRLLVYSRAATESGAGSLEADGDRAARRFRAHVGRFDSVRQSSRCSDAGIRVGPISRSRARIRSMSGDRIMRSTRARRVECPRAATRARGAVGRERAEPAGSCSGPSRTGTGFAQPRTTSTRNRDPNSVSGVKMLVTGGSTASVVLSAAFRPQASARRRLAEREIPRVLPSAACSGSLQRRT